LEFEGASSGPAVLLKALSSANMIYQAKRLFAN